MDKKRSQPYSNANETIEKINAQYGKLPPQAIDLEEAVLGAILLEREAYHKVAAILSDEVFYKEEHRTIFRLVDEMQQSGKTVDIRTLTQQAIDKQVLETIGGPLTITKLTSHVATAAHIEQHARIIYDKYVLREMIRAAAEITNAAYSDNDEADMVYTHETQRIDDLLAGHSGMTHIAQIMKRTTKIVEERQRKAEAGLIPGIPTGLVDLDRKTNGLQKTDLIIIGARPGMGKTAVALHLAKSAAKNGFAACIFSLEMSDTRLSERLILSNGGIEQENLKSGRMKEGDWAAYNRSAGELENLPIYIDDTSSPNVKYLSAVARNKNRRGECDFVVVDYLQLVESANDGYYNNKNREREVAEISRALKKLAKDLDIPVVLLVQLNRDVERRNDKTPMLADLRESGAIEQDADVVMFPFRPEYYDPDGEFEDGTSVKNILQIIGAKNREGSLFKIDCKKSTDFAQIFDLEPQMPDELKNFYETDNDDKF